MIPISKPIIADEEKRAVQEVMNSGMLAQGSKVKELETQFAKFCNTKYAVAVNSGTAALHCALYANKITPGDEVITVPFTFVATANPIIMCGAKPVFVDVEPDTFNIDPNLIRITEKTKAILPVDLFGQIYNYKQIKTFNKIIIEDACQAHGAQQNGTKAGNFGNAAAFSFYATKNMMSGEGGIVTTNDPEIAELARRLRHHGQSEQTRYEYYDIGYNYRMMDLQAAIALEQLKKLNEFTKKRRQNALKLTEGLKDIKQITTPFIYEDNIHAFHQYTIKTKDRDNLMKHLKQNDIGSGIYYPKPLHLHKHFAKFGYKKGDFPVSEQLSKEVLSLPVHPSLTDEDIKKIIKTIRVFF